jgi:hypothetical protein
MGASKSKSAGHIEHRVNELESKHKEMEARHDALHERQEALHARHDKFQETHNAFEAQLKEVKEVQHANSRHILHQQGQLGELKNGNMFSAKR